MSAGGTRAESPGEHVEVSLESAVRALKSVPIWGKWAAADRPCSCETWGARHREEPSSLTRTSSHLRIRQAKKHKYQTIFDRVRQQKN